MSAPEATVGETAIREALEAVPYRCSEPPCREAACRAMHYPDFAGMAHAVAALAAPAEGEPTQHRRRIHFTDDDFPSPQEEAERAVVEAAMHLQLHVDHCTVDCVRFPLAACPTGDGLWQAQDAACDVLRAQAAPDPREGGQG